MNYVEVGAKAPNFTLLDQNGKPHSFGGLQRKEGYFIFLSKR